MKAQPPVTGGKNAISSPSLTTTSGFTYSMLIAHRVLSGISMLPVDSAHTVSTFTGVVYGSVICDWPTCSRRLAKNCMLMDIVVILTIIGLVVMFEFVGWSLAFIWCFSLGLAILVPWFLCLIVGAEFIPRYLI
jgi:hypothetical protein